MVVHYMGWEEAYEDCRLLHIRPLDPLGDLLLECLDHSMHTAVLPLVC